MTDKDPKQKTPHSGNQERWSSAPQASTAGASAGDQATAPERPGESGGVAAGDVATPLQPGGTRPGGGPGAGLGSIGTGAGNTAGGATGSQKRSGN